MKGFFYGWYLKCQSTTQTLAVIPAIHKTSQTQTCSIQIITNENAWVVEFKGKEFYQTGQTIYIGRNRFGREGVCLSIHTPELNIEGTLEFGTLSPLKYDIMGPFALVPCMECRHMVFSMKHRVQGNVCINGQKYVFKNGWGYWEGDRGYSFPKEYIWTQCCFWGGALTLAVADIPIARLHFTGIIGVVLWKGKEYRFAAYLGARVVEEDKGYIKIVQGKMELEVQLLEKSEHALKAPANGEMLRVIHESVACKAFYRFCIAGETIFEFESDKASFEYEK